MMTEIINKLSVIQKTNEITCKQVLSWARRVEAPRGQKVLIEATEGDNEIQCHKRA